MLITPLAGLTEKKLNESLYPYMDILSENMLNYMCSMIALDESVISSSAISKEQMELLMSLELYQDIIRYNIYQRALNAAKNYEQQGIVTICPTDNIQRLAVTGKLESGEDLPFFHYECRGEVDKPNDHLIDLYEFKMDSDKRKEAMDSVLEKLDDLYEEKAQLEGLKSMGAEIYQLLMKNRNKISSQENKLQELRKYDHLTSQDIQMLQMQESFCQEFLKDYSINNADLKEEKKSSLIGHGDDSTKRMVKTYPSITVTKNIKNI